MVEFSQREYPIFTAGGGTVICLKKFIYKADKSGKVFYIQSGLHGGETSQWSLHILHDFLMDNLQCGEVHVVPYANPLAWMQRGYLSTLGKFNFIDGKDFNRCFPGNIDGDVSSRITAAIMEQAIQADFVLDLHTSKSSRPFVIYTQKNYEPFVTACGLPYNQYSDDANIPSLAGTFNAALDRSGIANICLECGGHNEYNEDNVEQTFDSICNLLAYFKMIEKDVCKRKAIYAFEKRQKVYADEAGLFRADKTLCSEVEEGEVIGRIFSSTDVSKVVEVRSPVSGVLLVLTAGHIIWQGDVVAEIVPNDNLCEIK